MAEPLCVLIVEDNERDAKLLRYQLTRAGFDLDCELVFTEEAYRHHLSERFDVILSDFSLPQFDGLKALSILNEQDLDIPFILVSGTIGEDRAVQAIKQGATDYVLKDRPTRLPEVVRKALRERDIRRQKQQAEDALRRSEARFRRLFQLNPLPIWVYDVESLHFREVNQAAIDKYGYTRDEFLKMRVTDIRPQEDVDLPEAHLQEALDNPSPTNRWRHTLKNGRIIHVDIAAHGLNFAGRPARLVVAHDVTKEVQAEQQLQFLLDLTRAASEAESFTQTLCLTLEKVCHFAGWDYGEAWVSRLNDHHLELSSAYAIHTTVNVEAIKSFHEASRAYVFAPGDSLPGRVWQGKQPEWIEDVAAASTEAYRRSQLAAQAGIRAALSVPIVTDDNVVAVLSFYATEPKPPDNALATLVSTAAAQLATVLGRRRAQEDIRRTYDMALDVMGVATYEGYYLRLNPAAEKLFGYSLGELKSRRHSDLLHPDDREATLEALKGLQDDKPVTFESRYRTKDGSYRWLSWNVVPYREENRVYFAARDVTERKKAEQMTTALNKELQSRNNRLQALYQTSQLINSSLDVNTILEQLITEAIRVTKATRGQILVVDTQRHHFERRAFYGFSKEERRQANNTPLLLTAGINGRCYRTKTTVNVGDVRTFANYHPLLPETRSELAVPIIHDDEVTGNIDLQSPEYDAFHTADIEYLEALAEQAATAISNARLYQKLEHYSASLEKAVAERTADLLQEKTRVEAILNATGEAIVVIDSSGVILKVNPAFVKQTGFRAEEVEQRDYHEIIPDTATGRGVIHALEHAAAMTQRGDTWQGELEVPRKDGSVYDAAVTIMPLRDDSDTIIGFVVAMRDVTPLKEVARMKDEFVSNVSHELRTPITSLKLNHRLIDMNPKKQQTYYERMARELERLAELIEDLLRLSRMDQGRIVFTFTTVNLAELIRSLIDDREPLAASKGLTLTYTSDEEDSDAVVTADGGLLGQVFSILLTNAINYTPSGGKITVNVHKRQDDARGRLAGFSVSDTGPGIVPEEQSRLFERFFRGSAGHNSKKSGTGLGLALAQEIVRRHQGFIEVDSEGVPGKGAAFTVWLPIEQEGRD